MLSKGLLKSSAPDKMYDERPRSTKKPIPSFNAALDSLCTGSFQNPHSHPGSTIRYFPPSAPFNVYESTTPILQPPFSQVPGRNSDLYQTLPNHHTEVLNVQARFWTATPNSAPAPNPAPTPVPAPTPSQNFSHPAFAGSSSSIGSNDNLPPAPPPVPPKIPLRNIASNQPCRPPSRSQPQQPQRPPSPQPPNLVHGPRRKVRFAPSSPTRYPIVIADPNHPSRYSYSYLRSPRPAPSFYCPLCEFETASLVQDGVVLCETCLGRRSLRRGPF